MRQIRLLFDRNQDIHTDYYYVYRSTSPVVTRQSSRIMKIAQIRKPNPVQIKETAKRINATQYQLTHRYIFNDQPLHVFVNGVELTEPVYQVDFLSGALVFDGEQLETDTVEVEYYFDGIEVIDDFGTNAHLDMNYYGPPARDNSVPEAPSNLSMAPNADGGMEIRFAPVVSNGITFYYAIEARNDKGSFSKLSPISSVQSVASVEHYIVETSPDGLVWTEKGSTLSSPFTDSQADNEPPEGLSNVEYTTTPVEAGVEVTITWATPLQNTKAASTPRYRVKTKLDNGNVSKPSQVVGPEQIISPIAKIVMLRKEGEIAPVYGDATAEMIADITEYNAGQVVHTLPVGKTYSYSLFVLDRAGNHSIARTLSITT